MQKKLNTQSKHSPFCFLFLCFYLFTNQLYFYFMKNKTKCSIASCGLTENIKKRTEHCADHLVRRQVLFEQVQQLIDAKTENIETVQLDVFAVSLYLLICLLALITISFVCHRFLNQLAHQKKGKQKLKLHSCIRIKRSQNYRGPFD